MQDVCASRPRPTCFGLMAMCRAFASLLIPAGARGACPAGLVRVCRDGMPCLFAGIYAVTKGAINSYSRVSAHGAEAVPCARYGCHGGHRAVSNIMNHYRRLPEDSLYKAARGPVCAEAAVQPDEGERGHAGVSDKHCAAGGAEGRRAKGGWAAGSGAMPGWYWAGAASRSWLGYRVLFFPLSWPNGLLLRGSSRCACLGKSSFRLRRWDRCLISDSTHACFPA